jgi:DNA-binding winged helix-turn-helix (wHTH) protein/tetratricopeptide (TPR) repeat protein
VTGNPEICFDGWRLRTDTGELIRDGQKQRLTQQPLRILVELLRKPGEVVTRERLVEVLWPQGVVDFDNGLNVAVRKLRLALGDDIDTPRYIETLARVGYRFIGKMEVAAENVPVPVAEPAPEVRRARVPRVWLMTSVAVAAGAVGLAWLLFARQPAADNAHEPEAGTPPIVARRTTSVRAYEAYLQGIFHRSRRDTNGTQLAIAAFETALREDPEYAEAWAGLSETYIGAGIGHLIPTVEAFTKARQAALRSVELDPGTAEGHAALGQIYSFFNRDYVAAEAEFHRAMAANPNYARLWHHLGSLRAFQGRADEALAAMRRARELEPMTLLFNSNYALVLYHARRYDEAIEHTRQLLVSQPRLHQARSVLIRALVAKGRVDEAAAQLPLRVWETPNLSDDALVHAHAGKRDLALAEVARIAKLSEQGFGIGYELAIAQAALGDMDAGCKALDLAWRDSSPFIGWMRLDPRMDPLRGQPCFAEILARFKSG